MRYVFTSFLCTTALAVVFLGFFIWYNSYITEKNSVFLYEDTRDIPFNKVGIVLGTSKYYQGGELLNRFYTTRINAAKKLYNAEKIDTIIVSGDNSTLDYDEPTTMKEDLIQLGVPEEKIYLDFAGFRTLDSIIRVKEIFGQESITVISQRFHNERAIHIARKNSIEAIGYNAPDVPGYYGDKVLIREVFARGKMFFDLLLGVGPKFLGESIEIP